MNDDPEQTPAGRKGKKTYSRPELTRLGAITELTSGGAGTKSETKSDMPPHKRP